MSVVYNPEVISLCIIFFLPQRKETNVAPHHIGAITDHQSMDRNLSSS
jgi:hypothetical protein